MSLSPDVAQRLTEIAARAQSAGRVPSVALAIVRDGALLHFEGVGEHPHPGPDTQYRLGSITKTLTATLVLQLRDEGFLASRRGTMQMNGGVGGAVLVAYRRG